MKNLAIRRLSMGSMIMIVLLLTVLVPGTPAAAQTTKRCFAETGFCIEGAIRQYWERYGGLPVFGFPKSNPALENVEGVSLTVQWFERDRLEIQLNGRVTAGRLGVRLLELQGTPWQQGPGESGGNGCLAFGETGYRTCGAFASYWQRNGGLERFGFPITGEFETTIDGKKLTIQYFERRRFELHSSGRVLLGLLGNEVLATQGESPLPIAAPVPTLLVAEDVINAFKNAGLEAENPRKMGKDDYGLAPFLCEGTRFLIPSLGEDSGGRVFLCSNDEDRDRLAAYYQDLGKISAIFFSWVFIKENVVVQLNGDLREDTARKYEQAIP